MKGRNMMIGSLTSLLLEAKKGNKDSLMEIITIFNPLIRKYGRKLLYDGAESDIILLIIKLIKSYPNPKEESYIQERDIVAYINISVQHEYIRLSKKFSNLKKMEVELNEDIYLIQSNDNIETSLLVSELLDKLSIIQKTILTELFFIGSTQTTLAKKLNISRQAVNKNKSKALNKLKNYLIDENLYAN
jgi:RNA polymerase sigma factor (sigma-70 family)